jgi:hypothetical protein
LIAGPLSMIAESQPVATTPLKSKNHDPSAVCLTS